MAEPKTRPTESSVETFLAGNQTVLRRLIEVSVAHMAATHG